MHDPVCLSISQQSEEAFVYVLLHDYEYILALKIGDFCCALE